MSEVAQYPPDWQPTTLAAIADYLNGYPFKPRDWSTVGLPIVRIAQMTDPRASVDYYPDPLPSEYRIDDGDLLFSWSATLTAMIWQRGPAYLNQHIFKVVPKNGHQLGFLHHLLNRLIEPLANQSHGTTMKHVTRADLLPFPVTVPLPDEQTRIAAVLDTVDEAIAKTEAVIAKLRQVRAGLLHDLLTRGLDHNGQLRDPIAHPEQFQPSPLGQIPKEWVFEALGTRLQRIGGSIQTGPFGSQLHAHEYTTEGVPVIMPQDVLEGSVSVAQIARIPSARAEELKRHRVKLGDIIFARRGDLSRCAAITAREVGWLCGTGCLLMRFGEATLSPHWLSLAYRHDIGQRQIAARAVGTTMVNLNTTLLSHLQFAFPLKDEQDEVVGRIAQTDLNIRRATEELAKLGLLKSGLMNDLLTGRVRVPAEKGK
jgi:type I restriction enzyme S subunit